MNDHICYVILSRWIVTVGTIIPIIRQWFLVPMLVIMFIVYQLIIWFMNWYMCREVGLLGFFKTIIIFMLGIILYVRGISLILVYRWEYIRLISFLLISYWQRGDAMGSSYKYSIEQRSKKPWEEHNFRKDKYLHGQQNAIWYSTNMPTNIWPLTDNISSSYITH